MRFCQELLQILAEGLELLSTHGFFDGEDRGDEGWCEESGLSQWHTPGWTQLLGQHGHPQAPAQPRWLGAQGVWGQGLCAFFSVKRALVVYSRCLVLPSHSLQVAERLGWEANGVRKERGGGEGFQIPCLHLRESGTLCW